MDSEKIIGCICGIVGLFGIGYAIGASSKLKSVSDAVNKSVDSIIADGKVDIPKEMINETIQNNVKEIERRIDKWKNTSPTHINQENERKLNYQKRR